jgi:Spy/CpxP family protein refolding chaperone
MNFFTKIRVTTWIIGLLVLLNVLTLGTIWFQQFRRPPAPLPPQDRRSENQQRFLERELGLTEQQSQQFQTLREQFFRQSNAIMQAIHQLRKAMMDELFSSSPDTQKAHKLAEEIGAKYVEQERLLFNHFLELKAVCQPAQQEKFQALMRDLLEMMTPPELPGPPRAARPGEPPRGPGERGAQTFGRPTNLPPQEMPREVVDACDGKRAGDACEFVTPRGETWTGSCRQTIQNFLVCAPEGNPPPGDRRPESPPPRDHPPEN